MLIKKKELVKKTDLVSKFSVRVPVVSKEIIQIWRKLQKKYMWSVIIFSALNVSVFVMTALITIFNLFALRFHHNPETKIYFLVIGIMTNIAAFFTTIISFFSFKKNYTLCSKKIKYMLHEKELFEAKNYEYKNDNRNSLYLQKIRKIYNSDKIDL